MSVTHSLLQSTYLLDNSAGIHLCGQINNLALHLCCKHLLLNLVAVLEKFLDDIVAKYILHELHGIRLYLPEDLILLIAIGSFEFLLDKTRPVLVSTELDDMIVDILDIC